jgi:hypothetical protein
MHECIYTQKCERKILAESGRNAKPTSVTSDQEADVKEGK